MRRLMRTPGTEDGHYAVSLHTLRHSVASIANELGFTEATIASILGHRFGTITNRYIHHLDAYLISAVNKVADHIESLLAQGGRAAEIDVNAGIKNIENAA